MRPFVTPGLVTAKGKMGLAEWTAYLNTRGLTYQGDLYGWTTGQTPFAKYGFLSAVGNTMWGYPQDQMTTDSSLSRCIQQALPSQTILNDIIATGSRLVIQTYDAGVSAEFFSQTRNGYTSASYPNFGASYFSYIDFFYEGVGYHSTGGFTPSVLIE